MANARAARSHALAVSVTALRPDSVTVNGPRTPIRSNMPERNAAATVVRSAEDSPTLARARSADVTAAPVERKAATASTTRNTPTVHPDRSACAISVLWTATR